MFKVFRAILIVLSLAAALLSIFAVTGSYENKLYLTKTYLLNIHIDNLDLSKLISSASKRQLHERDWASQVIDATGASGAASAVTAAATAAATAVSSLDEIANLAYSELGLSDVYQISYWGYCKGSSGTESGKDFDNSKVNITWCSKPKPGYKFDPVKVLLAEVNSTSYASYFKDLTDDDLKLPGSLDSKLKTFNNLVLASFGLLLAGAVLAVLSIVLQLLGCCMSPHSCCLSFLNFLYEVVIFVVLFVGSILVTFTMSYTKKQINDADYGIKSYLSINFYAFCWSAAVAALLCTIFNLLGHCCGLFGTGRRKFRQLAHEPEMAYHHEEYSDMKSMSS